MCLLFKFPFTFMSSSSLAELNAAWMLRPFNTNIYLLQRRPDFFLLCILNLSLLICCRQLSFLSLISM